VPESNQLLEHPKMANQTLKTSPKSLPLTLIYDKKYTLYMKELNKLDKEAS
jgi:hypothetical protein